MLCFGLKHALCCVLFRNVLSLMLCFGLLHALLYCVQKCAQYNVVLWYLTFSVLCYVLGVMCSA